MINKLIEVSQAIVHYRSGSKTPWKVGKVVGEGITTDSLHVTYLPHLRTYGVIAKLSSGETQKTYMPEDDVSMFSYRELAQKQEAEQTTASYEGYNPISNHSNLRRD